LTQCATDNLIYQILTSIDCTELCITHLQAPSNHTSTASSWINDTIRVKLGCQYWRSGTMVQAGCPYASHSQLEESGMSCHSLYISHLLLLGETEEVIPYQIRLG